MTSLFPFGEKRGNSQNPFSDINLSTQTLAGVSCRLVYLAMSNHIKDAAMAEAKSIQAASEGVLKSGAYLYPFKASHKLMIKGC
jgi:hypothetical protein